MAVIERTNNVIEQSFAIAKQPRTHLGRDLEDQQAQVALGHRDYVQVLCGTLDQMPRAFVDLDRQKPIGPPRLERTNRSC